MDEPAILKNQLGYTLLAYRRKRAQYDEKKVKVFDNYSGIVFAGMQYTYRKQQ